MSLSSRSGVHPLYKFNTRLELTSHKFLLFPAPAVDGKKEKAKIKDMFFVSSIGMIFQHPNNGDIVFNVQHHGREEVEVWEATSMFIDEWKAHGRSKTEFALYKELYLNKRAIESKLFKQTVILFHGLNSFQVSFVVFVYVVFVAVRCVCFGHECGNVPPLSTTLGLIFSSPPHTHTHK